MSAQLRLFAPAPPPATGRAWPPALIRREWDPVERRIVVALLEACGEHGAPALVAWRDLVAAANDAERRSLERRVSSARRVEVFDALVEVLGSDSYRRQGGLVLERLERAEVLSAETRGSSNRLLVRLDVERARDLGRDPALAPRVGDVGDHGAGWRGLLEIRRDGLFVVSAPGEQELWTAQGWRRWGSQCCAWTRGPRASQQLVEASPPAGAVSRRRGVEP